MVRRFYALILSALLSMLLCADAAEFPYKAKTDCAYGTYGCNRCVSDVVRTYREENSGAREFRGMYRFRMTGKTSLNGKRPHALHFIDGHIQGITRLAGVGDDNWVMMSRSTQTMGESGLLLVRFDGINSKGEAWEYSSKKSRRTQSYYYYKSEEINHGGGLQALGGLVFVGGECSNWRDCLGRVDIYDARDPGKFQLLNRLLIDGSQGELRDDQGREVISKVAAVAAAKLSDGRTLLFAGGAGSSKSGWLFISDSSEIGPKTKWRYLDYWHNSERENGDPWHGIENLNFISECGTGDLYLMGMGEQNRAYLYKLVQAASNLDEKVQINFVYQHGLQLNTSLLGAYLRMGGGVHITPQGKMVIYAVSRVGRKIEEFFTPFL